MSLLVLGLSHHRTPLDLLERAAADDASATAFERLALRGSHIHEALVLSTCNRTEVYADTLTFHGAISDLTAAFIASTDLPLDTLRPHLHVHYEERAVAHAFSVASGLEAMAVGEDQILGQIRSAL
ncbi:MAG TPA: glutamyl-tRNA reductase, partial [Phycicoccus sp.]|nr:glutamyl-tRNA reductase [Phycicoccus sp.]